MNAIFHLQRQCSSGKRARRRNSSEMAFVLGLPELSEPKKVIRGGFQGGVPRRTREIDFLGKVVSVIDVVFFCPGVVGEPVEWNE